MALEDFEWKCCEKYTYIGHYGKMQSGESAAVMKSVVYVGTLNGEFWKGLDTSAG